MKTLPQIAREIGVAKSTLKYQIDQCEQFIPYKKSGKDRLYDEQGENIIREINELFTKKVKSVEILDILESKYPREITVVGDCSPGPTNEQQQLMSVQEQIKFLMELIAKQQQDDQESRERERKAEKQEKEEFKNRLDAIEERMKHMSFIEWVKMKFGK